MDPPSATEELAARPSAPQPPVAPIPEDEAIPPPDLPTPEEIEALRREAEERGYAAGYQRGSEIGREEGHREGLTAAQRQIAVEVEKLSQILDFMSRPLAELDDSVEQELVYLAIEIARQLVRRELKTSPGEIVAVVRDAVGLLPVARQGLRVYLHPQDAKLVREAFDLDEQAPAWRIVEEPTLSRGGCKVVSEKSRIDATVEKRLGAVIATVLGDERREELEPS